MLIGDVQGGGISLTELRVGVKLIAQQHSHLNLAVVGCWGDVVTLLQGVVESKTCQAFDKEGVEELLLHRKQTLEGAGLQLQERGDLGLQKTPTSVRLTEDASSCACLYHSKTCGHLLDPMSKRSRCPGCHVAAGAVRKAISR